jgi:hypothetical protein
MVRSIADVRTLWTRLGTRQDEKVDKGWKKPNRFFCSKDVLLALARYSAFIFFLSD